MQVAPPVGQNWNQFKLHYMLAKFGTNAGGATCWSNLELIQVTHIQLAKFGTNASGIHFRFFSTGHFSPHKKYMFFSQKKSTK